MPKLNRQYSKLALPDGDYSFALNAVTGLDKVSSIENERGNKLCVELDTELVGQPLFIDRERAVLFCKDNSIRVANISTCTLTTHCQLPFGFDTLAEANPVMSTHRIVRGCENIVYFQDGLNKDRYVNLDRPEKQQTGGVFDITKFDFNPEIVHPTISREILNTGGNLKYGTYNFAVEFLTSNEDSLFISPVDINYTPISVSNIEGALNIETNDPSIGGKPLSNKSIKLTIDNVPDDAVLARIIVFRHLTGDGFTSDAHAVGSLIPVSGTSFTYTYRGFSTTNGDYLVDKNQYLIPKAIYQSSHGSVQVNTRLVRYNLIESVKDYSNYQQYASKICAKYIVGEVNKDNPNIYILNQTLLGGEIILPCINYVHKDGTISNSFPLIGRAKNTNDATLVNDIFTNNQVEKWKLYDTSIKDGVPITGYVSSGEFGYYESDQFYTAPPNYCQEDSYWGTDCDGNPLQDTPVRLFVVPDRSKEQHDTKNPLTDKQTIRPIGIWFDSSTIEYPNDDVVGHYFSIATSVDSNIRAKGITIDSLYLPDNDNPEILNIRGGYVSPYAFGTNTATQPFYNFISAEGLVKNEYIGGDYLTSEGYWLYDQDNDYEDDVEYDDIFDGNLPYDNLNIDVKKTTATEFGLVVQEHLLIDNVYKVDAKSTVVNRANQSLTNNFDVIDTPNQFDSLGLPPNIITLRYTSVRDNINPIPNIWSLTTRRITNINENISFRGSSFISPLLVDNIGEVTIDGASAGDIAKAILFGGVFGTIFGQGLLGILNGGSDVQVWAELLRNFYVESSTNLFLRHKGTDNCSNGGYDGSYHQMFFNKVCEPYNDKFKIKDSFCPFFPGYNLDYSYVQDLNKYFNLRLTYDFCSKCTGLYPHRIIFSPQSFSEDLSDQFRVNLPNDYIDIPAHAGEIVKVDFRDNKLIVRTKRSSFFLIPNPQQMETSESNVYIGTGDFLSIPAQEISVSPTGFGGQQHPLDSLNFEKGLVWTDKERNEIYFLGGEFTELQTDIQKWYVDTVTNRPVIFTYDPYYDRLIMTNRENFTLSYCFKHQGWKSFHSYIPDWYAYNHKTFFSVANDGIWSHNANKYHLFYNLEFPSIKEIIIKSQGQTFVPQSIVYHGNVYTYVNGFEEDILKTYDQFLAYNDRQTTGIQTLRLDDESSIYFDNLITHVKRAERDYKISHLKDLSLTPVIWNPDISSIKQGQHGYVDNLPIFNSTKKEVEQADFRSKWVGVRLITNDHDNKYVLEYTTSNNQQSIR